MLLGVTIVFCVMALIAAVRISSNRQRRAVLREIWELKVQTSTGEVSLRQPRTKDWLAVTPDGWAGLWSDFVGIKPPTKVWIEDRRGLVVNDDWLQQLIAAIKQMPEIRTVMVRERVATPELIEELRSSLPNVSVLTLERIPGRR